MHMARFTSNITGATARLQFRKIDIGAAQDATYEGLNSAMALMKRRIFNKSQAADRSPLGPYISEAYKAKRRAAGRQVGRKDLQFSDRLFKGIQVFRVRNNRVEIRFTRTDLALIARSQEIQIQNIRAGRKANSGVARRGIPIFVLNDDERKNALDVTRRMFEAQLRAIRRRR